MKPMKLRKKSEPTKNKKVDSSKGQLHLPNWIIYGLRVLVILVIGALAVWAYLSFFDKTSEVSHVEENDDITSLRGSDCAEIFLSNFEAITDPAKHSELPQVLEELRQQKDYETTPDCLYPFVQYYVHSDDLGKSKEYLGKLKTALKEKSFDESVVHIYKDMDTMEKEIELLESRQELIENSLFYGASPSQ